MTAAAPRDPSLRGSTELAEVRDIASAYLASAIRIGSWVVVSALVYRYLGAAEFGILALIRGTVGILNYVTLGLAPALIHYGAIPPAVVAARPHRPTGVLEYAAKSPRDFSLASLYANAMAIGFWLFIAGIAAVLGYATQFDRVYPIPAPAPAHLGLVVLLIGLGTLLRLVGDLPGAVIQVRGLIAADNLLVSVGDLVWAVASGAAVLGARSSGLLLIALAYPASGLIPLAGRALFARRQTRAEEFRAGLVRWDIAKLLLAYGGLVVLAQLADYLYAPTDYILIARLLGPLDLANYAPAVQIDAGLLLLVTGLSAVLLPKTAVAHAAGSSNTVRRYYVRGTLASLAMLAIASAAVWAASPLIFRVWLGNSMPATRAILPLVLVNTVLGGSSAVGRSILLAVGKVRPFTVAALTSGVVNVACSYAFVRFLGMGLKGIVLGTVVAVVGRCVIWMPWYVLRTIRKSDRIEPVIQPSLAPQL